MDDGDDGDVVDGDVVDCNMVDGDVTETVRGGVHSAQGGGSGGVNRLRLPTAMPILYLPLFGVF